MTAGLLTLLLLAAEPTPDPPTLAYYNARMALREERPTEALKLWFVRNVLEDRQGLVSAHDSDFHTVTWVALGSLGLCQDGLPTDGDGVGLWPLALHNWFIRNMRRGDPPDAPDAYEAFGLGRQARLVSLSDVLSVQELRTLRFFRTGCYRMDDVLVEAGLSSFDEPGDPDNGLEVIETLLRRSLRTMAKDRVRGRAVIEARLMDLRLNKIERLEKKLVREERRVRRESKRKKLPPGPPVEVLRTRQMQELMAVTRRWTVEDWLSLERERRLFLFDFVMKTAPSGDLQRKLQIAMIDALVARGDGREAAVWMGMMGDRPEARARLWSGARGKRLLGLDRETGFRERSAIALHRGVDAMGRGDLEEALRAFAYGLHHAEDSSRSEDVRRLSLRWLSYVASRFEVTDDLVAMLVALVPRGDLGVIIEDLVWGAAFRADQPSFERLETAQRGRGASRRRIERLRPLAEGDAGRFLTGLRADLEESPHATLRFLKSFMERLQTEDGDVRLGQRGTLVALRELLVGEMPAEQRARSITRKVTRLDGQAAAMLEGMPGALADRAEDRARGLSPTREVFAGSIRLAPSDPLPWPFPKVAAPRAPSVFTRLPITPIEWPGHDGLVFGWKLGR